MKRILSFYFLFFFLLPILSYSQGTNLSLGNEFISSLLVEKNYAQAYTFFDESVKSKIAEPLLKETVEKLEMQLGKFKSVIETTNENETYLYYADFEKFKLDIRITFNEKSKIIGFFFVPHKEFKKQPSLGKEYTIKSNGIDLKGTLLIPENGNLKKLVLFVHGSGPNDRDETVFENKPFKDIAESLFANGIASYRFDKRTYTNPESFSDKSTIDDEVTNDILNIVKYQYKITLDENSMNYARFITHLQYFAQRIVSHDLHEQQENELYMQVKTLYPEAFQCVQKIKVYIYNKHQVLMSNDEDVYLTLHVMRVTQRQDTRR